ncbi:MAG: NAD(+)/NADH kinase [Lachnospiraceae bacterium]|nr:NAD(+)/NADH kinase [Lachnospiraceae bacterium]
MKKFFVITNETRDPKSMKAASISEYIRSRGGVCEYASIERDSGKDDAGIQKIMELSEDTEAAIILGGDGTFIQCAGLLAKKKIPMIGVNLGHLGYLAEVDKEKITPALERLMNDDHEITGRMILSGTPVINGESLGEYNAVNDIVVKTSGSSVGSFLIEVNDTYLTTISGDGIVVATPTGSTAYNMSAGGPIIEPGSSMIVITPICPLEVVSRSVVLSANDTVVIKLIRPSGKVSKSAEVFFDGRETHTLSDNDSVVIRKSSESIKLIKLSRESFLEVLSRKMSV